MKIIRLWWWAYALTCALLCLWLCGCSPAPLDSIEFWKTQAAEWQQEAAHWKREATLIKREPSLRWSLVFSNGAAGPVAVVRLSADGSRIEEERRVIP